MKYLFVACLLCLSVLSAVAKVPAMNKIRLTNNWEYLKGDLGGIWEAVSYTHLTLPTKLEV